MKLGVFHEVGLACCATAALLLVLLGGELPVFMWLTLAAPWMSLLLRQRGRHASNGSGTLLGIASLVLGGVQITRYGLPAIVLGGAVFLMGLLVARLITRSRRDHDLQVVVISFMLVVSGAVLNVNISFAVCFIIFALLGVWVLMTREILMGAEALDMRQAEDSKGVIDGFFFVGSAGLSIVVLFSVSAMFVFFPRIGFLNLNLSGGGGLRFPDDVSLTTGPFSSSSDERTMVTVKNVSDDAFRDGLYLRGGVYEGLDEQGFARAKTPLVPPKKLRRAPAPRTEAYEVFLRPFSKELLFSLGSVTKTKALRGGGQNPNFPIQINGRHASSEISAAAPVQTPFRYRIEGGVSLAGFVPKGKSAEENLTPEQIIRLTELPQDLDPRIAELAARYAGKGSDIEKAIRIREKLLREYTYTLDFEPTGKETPLAEFLFTRKTGHCELFAAAYALLLRSQNIPARIVGGFMGGTLDEESGEIDFSNRNAHAWIEWYAPQTGWIVDDATPAASEPRSTMSIFSRWQKKFEKFWDDDVVDYSIEDQAGAFHIISSWWRSVPHKKRKVAALITLLSILGGAFYAWRRRRRRGPREHRLLDAVLALCRKSAPNEDFSCRTAREALFLVIDRLPKATVETAQEAIARYESIRFSGYGGELHTDELLIKTLKEAARGVSAANDE